MKFKPNSEAVFSEEPVTFVNVLDHIKLSGTLSMPMEGKNVPCVILISGSGPQTRDQHVAGHKIFKDISDRLASNGIAVLRFDDRGVGDSEGVFETAGLLDFRNDVIAAIDYLTHYRRDTIHSIGVLGHSLGGLVAPMVENIADGRVAFVISLAGPGMRGSEIYREQHLLIAKEQGMADTELELMDETNRKICELVININEEKALMQAFKDIMLSEHRDKTFFKRKFSQLRARLLFIVSKKQINLYNHPWFKDWLMLEPEKYWSNVRCPTLVVNGQLDVQCPAKNVDLIKAYIESGGNREASVKLFSDHNHLFQRVKDRDRDMLNYKKIKSSISNEATDYITSWIRHLV
ncbi:alpha/beta hydrolase family protein [Amphibacillus cookii]|uniref:alpha/beta hydrolase family protein n=1 Tax=Amphibacillus cookii TaxID=767787 RepID=UPI0019578850|nr:alpha/beta hydrolase [Amphibacillus cookii]MBM7542244.1 alpha/beta superfamily hydrolase [Amphibacillus cookii]